MRLLSLSRTRQLQDEKALFKCAVACIFRSRHNKTWQPKCASLKKPRRRKIIKMLYMMLFYLCVALFDRTFSVGVRGGDVTQRCDCIFGG